MLNGVLLCHILFAQDLIVVSDSHTDPSLKVLARGSLCPNSFISIRVFIESNVDLASVANSMFSYRVIIDEFKWIII